MAEGTRLAAGSVLGGRYRLEEVIGVGGMAAVWRAEDLELGRKVAIKAISETLLVEPAYLARFEREAKIAAGLLHPNLVKVFDYGAGEGQPYLVMEYIEGPTLAAVIAGGDLAVDADRLAAELLDALRQIHAAGVVHRDVKPANVLVDGTGTAKLTDFGIARSADATQLTQTGQVIGTLAYMAPEVKEGREADERSDLYSVGVVLRECAKWGGSASLIALIERLTAADPEGRPQSAAAALEMLGSGDAAAAAEPTVPFTAPAPAPASARRRRRWLAALLAIAAAAIVILLVTLDSDGGDSDSATVDAKQDSTTAKRQQRPETTDQPSQQSTPPPATPSPQPETTAPSPIPCDQVEERKAALEEERKAAEEAAGDDKEAKEQVKDDYEELEKQLKEREESCKEAEKEAEEDAGDDLPPGLEKKKDVPAGHEEKD